MTSLTPLLLSTAVNVVIAQASPSSEQWIGHSESVNAVSFGQESCLTKGKTDGEALPAVVEARTLEGSKACIDFIREASMNM